MQDARDADDAVRKLDGFRGWVSPSTHACDVNAAAARYLEMLTRTLASILVSYHASSIMCACKHLALLVNSCVLPQDCMLYKALKMRHAPT